MYLREIGKVYLLTADDEKRLARAMEEGKHIQRIERRWLEEHGRPARGTEDPARPAQRAARIAPLLQRRRQAPRAEQSVALAAHRRPHLPLGRRRRARPGAGDGALRIAEAAAGPGGASAGTAVDHHPHPDAGHRADGRRGRRRRRQAAAAALGQAARAGSARVHRSAPTSTT